MPRYQKPWRARLSTIFSLTSLMATSLCLSATASAESPLEELIKWAPTEANAAIIYRFDHQMREAYTKINLSQLKLDNPTIQSLISSISLERMEVMGVNLARGVAMFQDFDRQAHRFVLSIDDWDRFMAELSALQPLLDQAGVKVSQEEVTIGGRTFKCLYAKAQLACDNARFQAGPAPSWAQSLPKNATVWLHLSATKQLSELLAREFGPQAASVSELNFTGVTQESAHQMINELRLNVKVVNPMLGMLSSSPEPKALSQAHATSGALLRVALPTALKAMVIPQLASAPPSIAPVLTSFVKAISGELQLSFAGGYSHPLLSIGLASQQAAEPFIEALAGLDELNAKAPPRQRLPLSIQVERRGAGLAHLRLTMQNPRGEPQLTLSLYLGVHNGVMHLALYEADLKRLMSGAQGTSLPFPASHRGSLVALQFAQPLDGLVTLMKLIPMIQVQGGGLNSELLNTITQVTASFYRQLFDLTLGAQISAQDGLTIKLTSRMFKEAK